MSMSDLPPYPPIDPTTYDLIVVGTGLPQSVIASAASASGKSVLHLDPNPFYGSHFSSLSIPELTSFLLHHSPSPPPSPSPLPSPNHSLLLLNLISRPLYSDVEISSFAPESHLSKFILDVSGPRVLFCADKCIDLMLKGGANHYLEFKSIDGCFVGPNLRSVPDSRAAIFQDKNLKLNEKKQLTKFFKLVQSHLAAADHEDAQAGARISEDDLETPFVDFLTKMGLPPSIKSIILYAIAMADYDQENLEACKDYLLNTRDGIDRLALYQSSIGRFTNAFGAFIYPIYGQGELPQAFCRRAAVKGCIYVLRMPVISLLLEKSSGSYKGVRLASGQDIFSHKLVLDPSFTIPPLPASPSDTLSERLNFLNLREVKKRVARGICITRNSLKPDKSSFLVIYPPRSLYPEQLTSIRALQIGGNHAVCPPNMFLLYLSTFCDDVNEGKKLLNAAIDVLLNSSDSIKLEGNSLVQIENTEEPKPTLLWRALYIQEQTMGLSNSISFTSMPDGSPNYNNVMEAAMKLFQDIYPTDEFFPETSPENSEDDSSLNLET